MPADYSGPKVSGEWQLDAKSGCQRLNVFGSGVNLLLCSAFRAYTFQNAPYQRNNAICGVPETNRILYKSRFRVRLKPFAFSGQHIPIGGLALEVK